MDDRLTANGARRSGEGAAIAGAPAPPRPTVSAVICTVNRPQLLRAAIASIVAQRYNGVVETIVVYDGTEPDESLNSADPLRPVTVMGNTHRPGLPAGRNCGAEAALTNQFTIN